MDETQLLSHIEALRLDSRFEEASQLSEIALNEFPHSAPLQEASALLALDLGDPVSALERFLIAVSLAPDRLEARRGMVLALLGCGRLDEAQHLLNELLAKFPKAAKLHRAQGNLALTRGQLGEAKQHFQTALKLDAKDPETYNELANLHQITGQWREAEANYRRAIGLRPRYAIAHYNLGAVLLEAKREREALTCYETAATLDPNFYEAVRDYAFTLQTVGKFNEALVMMYRALALESEDGSLYSHLTQTLGKMRAYEQIVEVSNRWQKIAPKEPEAYRSRAQSLFLMNRVKEAIPDARKALQLSSNSFQTLHLLANALSQTRQYPEADQIFRQGLAQHPHQPDLMRDYSQLLGLTGRLDEAEALLWSDTDSAQNPRIKNTENDVKMWVMRGWIRMGQGRFDEAKTIFENVLSATSNKYPQARFGKGHVSYLLGDYRGGYEGMEGRLDYPGDRPHPAKAKPLWIGQPIPGKRLLVYVNHGLGDEMQFLRYFPFVKERSQATIVFVSYPALRPFYSDLPGAIPGVDEIVIFDPTQPFGVPFDYRIEQMSLPLHTEPDPHKVPLLENIFRVPEEKRTRWCDYIREHFDGKPGIKIGLRWAGNPANATDPYRSADLSDFAPLFDNPDLSASTWISLQTDGGTSRIKELGLEEKIHDPTALLTDFGETAALMETLDLIISVDTSLVHLAGTLKLPVWTLLAASPDWRWLLDRADTPWYPTMRLFRQKNLYDWSSVITELAAAIFHRFLKGGQGKLASIEGNVIQEVEI